MSIVIKPSPVTHPSGVLTCFVCNGEKVLTDQDYYTIPCPECQGVHIVKKEPNGGPASNTNTDSTDGGA